MMTVLGTGISWTNSTWNPWVGCRPVSEGCKFCYAAGIVNNPYFKFGHRFDEVRIHLNRLVQVGKFRPIPTGAGVEPHKVFVNSMSDFFIEDVPDTAIHQALDAMEGAPDVVFQILSKRPIRARKVITDRFGGGRGVPEHIWFGFSAEDNRVAARIRILRGIKERVGSMVAFLSVEPIVGPTDALDFTDMSWVITGGESGASARVMPRPWLMPAVERALSANVPLWHKQHGQILSHPNIDRAADVRSLKGKLAWLVENGWEKLPKEKGGATIDGVTYRAFPVAYDRLTKRLNASRASLV
ncbi:MAG TPA: DUF5131 family protein [Acetobacteraceae bacterium]|jgi:protein gp37|nr:DUF5131 family protein [Acetobacteraceae bacterium]